MTTESRRLFGVIEEKAVTIVLDIRNMSPLQFDQYRTALERVLREQIQQLTKFNMIRACEDTDCFSADCVPVTYDTVEGAVQWLWGLDRLAPLSTTATCESILNAMADAHNEAIYLFTEGSAIDSSRELLKEKVISSDIKIPIHIVSFNCNNSDTIRYIKDLVMHTKGRFHAYAVVMEVADYHSELVNPLCNNKANILIRKKTYGGMAQGVGVREDVILIFEEMEEARNIHSQVKALLVKADQPKIVTVEEEIVDPPTPRPKNDDCISSADWIKRFGLDAQRLGLYHILSGVAFKHQDGVVEIMEKPPEDAMQTDAVSRTMLINARYCDQFPVVRWKNGQIVHVQVTPDIHRLYEQRMAVALEKIQKRKDWLKQGSRELFGTVLEDHIYILIDCSQSMSNSIQFVKDKLFLLMQEQLKHKRKFNLISFNSKVTCWRDRLVEVTEYNMRSAWTWVQGLTCWGSTNTYAAVTHVLNDPEAEAMYLLSDGRPDQPPKSVLAQVQMKHKVPIHTISFNCNDTDANRFLYELSRTTAGRYHYFSEEGIDPKQPESYESEDVQLLKKELQQGLDNLAELAKLRDECASMAWRRQTNEVKKSNKENSLPGIDSRDSILSPCRSISPSSRPSSAPPCDRHSPTPPRLSSSMGLRTSSSLRESINRRPLTARSTKKPALVASHTRTSLLRTLNSSGRFSDFRYLLPETRQLFQKQADRKQNLQEIEHKNEIIRKRREKRFIRANKMSSKLWLKKHGLMAQHLTILDALAPTFVPHRSKYIPILDKHVVSKVFDQILPLAHVSPRTKQEIRLISPSAVDLDRYQQKVRKALQKYHRRLDELVWSVLSKSAKAEYDSETPISFVKNHSRLMDLLEQAGWPVKEEDIQLLLQEIQKGELFIQQAKDLRQATSSQDSAHLEEHLEEPDTSLKALESIPEDVDSTGGTDAGSTGGPDGGSQGEQQEAVPEQNNGRLQLLAELGGSQV